VDFAAALESVRSFLAAQGYSNHLSSDPALGRVDFVYVADGTAERIFATASSCDNPSRAMDVSRPTNGFSKSSDPTLFEVDIPTSEVDIRRLRELREAPVERLLERINDLSATRQFPNLAQRRDTSAGFEPFTLPD
jgi:hypothetical protein